MLRSVHLVILSVFVSANLAVYPAAADPLSIVGTGDGMVILQGLAETFHARHPRFEIVVPESIGSSGGIKAVGNGKDILGRVARPLRDNEKAYGLTYRPFAKVSVAFFVNESVDVESLSATQILDIFSGQIRDWRDVGGRAGRIRVIRREEGDSSLRVLRNTFPGFKSISLTKHSKTAITTQENIDALSEFEGTIGFGPLTEAVGTSLRALAIDRRAPDDINYISQTVLALIYKEPLKVRTASTFLEFLGTDSAREVIRRVGALPVD